MEGQIEKIVTRIFRRRMDQHNPPFSGWEWKSLRELRPAGPREFIKQKLSEGCQVSGGFYTTGIRGYHDYFVVWKNK